MLSERIKLFLLAVVALLPLLGEDRESLARSADRTERCERLLLRVLDLAQAKAPKISRPAKAPQPGSLF